MAPTQAGARRFHPVLSSAPITGATLRDRPSPMLWMPLWLARRPLVEATSGCEATDLRAIGPVFTWRRVAWRRISHPQQSRSASIMSSESIRFQAQSSLPEGHFRSSGRFGSRYTRLKRSVPGVFRASRVSFARVSRPASRAHLGRRAPAPGAPARIVGRLARGVFITWR